ncbi:MAG: radical SAM protein [Acidobacteriia bacterium]|nr:radical SAM protein [Terriglobia bacterium]
MTYPHTLSLFPDPSLTIEPRPTKLGRVDVGYAPARDILTRASGFMDAYDFTLNPYAGCSFGCTYCYAAFFSHDAEKRHHWGLWVDVKENAIERLRSHRRSLDGKLIYMSSVTDPYQPIERQLNLTRGLLEILARRRPKLVVQTRSPDVLRDVDLFRQIVNRGGRVQVNMTITTDDEDIRRTFEPFCPGNPVRLDAARELAASGVQTCVTMTPLLLVRDPGKFAEDLSKTGVKDFIVQPFHFQRGRFIANTRDAAIHIMVQKLSSDSQAFREAYLQHYRNVREVLQRTLPKLGEGKDGFRPPF